MPDSSNDNTTKRVKLNIYPEICCEECNEIIHNHLDCPVCGTRYAPSTVYIELEQDEDGFYYIGCEKCGSEFESLDPHGGWKIVHEGKLPQPIIGINTSKGVQPMISEK